MDKKEKLKNIWAMADKPLIDVMKKKSPHFSTTLNDNSSDDDTSDSTSDSDSDFSALPEEFRPNLNIESSCLKERVNDRISLTQKSKKTPSSRITYNKKFLGNAISDTQTVNKRIESQKQNERSNHSSKNFDVNLNTSQKINSPEKRDELIGRSTSNTSLNKSKKHSVQYEYVQRQNMLQEPHSIKIKLDMHSTRDNFSSSENGLTHESKLAQSASVRSKNLPDVDDRIMKQKFCSGTKKGSNSKGDLPISFHMNNIKWDDSLSLKPQHNRKIKHNYIQTEKRVSTTALADNSEKLKKEFATRQKSNKESENIWKFNNSRLNEKSNDQNSKSNSICCPPVKNAESRPKYDKKSIKCIFKENNLQSVKERKIKYAYVNEQNFIEKEIEYLNITYAKDYKYNIRKQNISLYQSSGSETLDLPCASQQKLKDNILLSNDSSCKQDRNTVDKSSQNIEEQRNCILNYGKEVSNLITGSYTALSMLASFYREWTVARRELLTIFKQLEKNLQESSKTYSKYADIIKVAKTGSALVSNLPYPAVSMTAKIVSIITGLLHTLLKSKEDQINIDGSHEVTTAMFKDTQTTSELHMHVLQCSQQFEETTKFIRQFHSDSKIQKYFDNENPEITTFIKGFLEYKPDHCIFYKKLHKCFCELLQTSSTSLSKSFCEPFSFYSSATEVIEYLSWHFHSEDFDSTSVNHELEAISHLIQTSNNTTVEDLLKRIRNCIIILTEELDFRERCMKDISLFDTSTISK